MNRIIKTSLIMGILITGNLFAMEEKQPARKPYPPSPPVLVNFNGLGMANLKEAISKGDSKVIAHWLKSTNNPNIADQHGTTLLMYAAALAKFDIVLLLLDAQVNTELQDQQGRTALLHAARENRLEIALLLMSRGANKEVADAQQGMTALMYASKNNNALLVENLLTHQVSIEQGDRHGKTALRYALEYHANEVALLLLSRGADINSRDNQGYTALLYTVANEDVNLAHALVDLGAQVDIPDNTNKTPLMYACEQGNLAITNLLLTKNPAVEEMDYNHMTALMYAAHRGYNQIIGRLLSQNASINKTNDRGATALCYAIDGKCFDTVLFLLDREASIMIPLRMNITFLMLAANVGHKDIVLSLLYKKVPLEIENTEGATAVMYAATNNDPILMHIFQTAGAILNHIDHNGCDALTIAAHEGHKELVVFLLATDLFTIASKSKALEAALESEKDCTEVVQALIQSGAPLEYTSDTVGTMLMIAVKHKKLHEVALLLIHGVDPNSTRLSDHTSALHVLLYEEDGTLKTLTGIENAIFNLLLHFNADVSASDSYGHKPYKHPDVKKQLAPYIKDIMSYKRTGKRKSILTTENSALITTLKIKIVDGLYHK